MIKRRINSYLEDINRRPVKVIRLSTGITLRHYKNGSIKTCKYD